MIDLTYLKTRLDVPSIIDFGGVTRPATGAKLQRIDRLGNRFKIGVTLPPLQSEDARIIIADLIAAKTQGGRVYFPLEGIDQGYPGNPVVRGAGQQGRRLRLRGLTPHYAAKKGFWFSIENSNGQHFLHNVQAAAIADAAGLMELSIETALRTPFPDGCKVHLGKPMIEGLIDGNEFSWNLALGQWTDPISFLIEEAE